MNSKKEIFNILNDFFDQIYIISLKRSTKRHTFIDSSLKGLNYTYFWAVDGRELDINELEKEGVYDPFIAKQIKERNKALNKEMLVNAIGCAMSHLGVYRKMLENNHNTVLVLEDDIIVDKSSIQGLNKALGELPPNWEMLYLGYLDNNLSHKISTRLRLHFAYPILYHLGYKRFDPSRYRCRFARPYSEHLNLSGYHYGTHSYGITRDGAKKLIDFQTPIVREADNAAAELCSEEKIYAFNIKNRVFYQNRDEFASLIEENEFKKSSVNQNFLTGMNL